MTPLNLLQHVRDTFRTVPVDDAHPVVVERTRLTPEDVLTSLARIIFAPDMEQHSVYAPNAISITGRRPGENLTVILTVTTFGDDLRMTMDATRQAGKSTVVNRHNVTDSDVLTFATAALNTIHANHTF